MHFGCMKFIECGFRFFKTRHRYRCWWTFNYRWYHQLSSQYVGTELIDNKCFIHLDIVEIKKAISITVMVCSNCCNHTPVHFSFVFGINELDLLPNLLVLSSKMMNAIYIEHYLLKPPDHLDYPRFFYLNRVAEFAVFCAVFVNFCLSFGCCFFFLHGVVGLSLIYVSEFPKYYYN